MAEQAGADAQELMAQFEYVQQALQTIDNQLARLEQNAFDLRRAMSTLEAIGDGEAHETLVPIGGGLHLRASVTAEPVVSPVGRGYAVDHDVQSARQDLEKRIAAADAAIQAKSHEAERLAAAARQMATQLQQLDAGMV